MKRTVHSIFALILIAITHASNAQDYKNYFEEGRQLFNEKKYYEAYQRFNVTDVLARNAGRSELDRQYQSWIDSCAYGIQVQQRHTDSLLQAARKLTESFYFYEGRLALAYKNDKFGFIDKQGEVVIPYEYEEATHFDNATGYAKVKKDTIEFWLSPDGKTYPANTPVGDLPIRIKKDSDGRLPIQAVTDKKVSKAVPFLHKREYSALFQEGLNHYNSGKYYEAFQFFNASAVLADNANQRKDAEICRTQQDAAIQEMLLLTENGGKALAVAKKLNDAFYFAYNRFALAYKDGQFYFMDKDGDPMEKLGRWEQAGQFGGWMGFATVQKSENGRMNNYLLDTLGNTYQLARRLEDLNKRTVALNLYGYKLSSCSK